MSVGTVAAPSQETVQVAQEIPREGTVMVSLAQVDLDRFPNYRLKATETHLMDLRAKIKEHKQLTPCVGAWIENGMIGLIDGFCRFEAMERLALEKLVNEYNTTNGKEPGQEGHVALGGFGFKSRKEREKIRDAGGEWAAKYDAALKSYNIQFRTVVVEDKADAALKSIVANTYDKPPLMDLCARIEALLELPDISAKRVAKALKLSESAVSQHRKIHACPNFLREKFNGDLSELSKKPEEQNLIREQLLTAVSEFERRLSLDQESPQSISFSHAREFSGTVMHAKEPMSLAGVAKALRDLVVMHDNGKLSPESNTPEYKTFMDKLRDARRIGKEPPAVEPTAAAAGTAGTAGTTTSPAVAVAGTHDTSSLSAEDAAKFAQAGEKFAQHEAATVTAPATAPVSTGNQTLPTAATVTPVVSQPSTLSPEDQARQAEIEAANEPASDAMDTLTGPSTESLIAADGEETIAVIDGQMKTKTTDAPVPDKYRNAKPPQKVELAANRMLDYALDDRTSVVDQSGYLLASAQLFNAVGMETAEQAVNEVFVNYNDGLNKYLTALEEAVKNGQGEAVLKEIKALAPKPTRPNLNG